MDKLKRKYTNNTLEEELREQLCEQLKEINSLKAENALLKITIAQETEQRYNLYKKISPSK